MANLTGLWEGQYKYPGGWQAPVSFDADITDKSGQIRGIISEPNSFDEQAGPLLTAALAGQVSGAYVNFTKTYVGEGRAQHSLIYEGRLLEDDNRIIGTWRTGMFSGEFEMNRLSSGAIEVIETKEEIKI